MSHIQRGLAACSYLIILTYLGRVFSPIQGRSSVPLFLMLYHILPDASMQHFYPGNGGNRSRATPQAARKKQAGSKLLPAVDFLIENV